MSEVKVGDRVRSFDFDGRDLTGEKACFIEGDVVAIGRPPWCECDRYIVRVAKRIAGGREVNKPAVTEGEDLVFPPVNGGTPKLFGGVCDGVVRIGD